jgi:hypothetical protein
VTTGTVHEIRCPRPGIDPLPQSLAGLNPVLRGCEKCNTTIWTADVGWWLKLRKGDTVRWLCTDCMTVVNPKRQRGRKEH